MTIRDLKINPETKSTILAKDIVYPDLVRTLRYDSSKLVPIEVSPDGTVLQDDVFARAAREAGLEHVLVRGEFPDEVVEAPKGSGIILQNFVYFIGMAPSMDKLDPMFDAYVSACKAAIRRPFHKSEDFGSIDALSKRILDLDCCKYVLHGSLVNPDSKELFNEATRILYNRLKEISPIRSVNGRSLYFTQPS